MKVEIDDKLYERLESFGKEKFNVTCRIQDIPVKGIVVKSKAEQRWFIFNNEHGWTVGIADSTIEINREKYKYTWILCNRYTYYNGVTNLEIYSLKDKLRILKRELQR